MPRSRAILASLATLLLIAPSDATAAEPRFAGVFSDHVVLQRDAPVRVWGRAASGARVTVEFGEQTVTATATASGEWSLTLEPRPASRDARELVLRAGGEPVVVRDVLVGDVWHASGQSNLAMSVASVAARLEEAKQHIAMAELPAIRFRRIHEGPATSPREDVPVGAGWVPCSPTTAPGFSAAAFYFARRLHAELDVPIGIIDTSRGGTPIEPFIPREAFTSHPTLRRELELGDADDLDGIWRLPGGVRARDANWLPGRLFHSRLAPIARFAVRGAIWYQGESNCGVQEDPRDYEHKMRALVNGWRVAFDDAKLPVYFVQLPGSGAGPGWPYLREQQRLAADLPHTGLVVTIDLLDGDIHPPNKVDVGERLARWALAEEYGRDIPRSGPLFRRARIADGEIRVDFAHAESGLMVARKDGLEPPRESPAEMLAHFELANASGEWHPAVARIDGSTLVVRSDAVPGPIAVRYAHEIDPQHCHLYNRDGLPAAPFCSRPDLLRHDPGLPAD